MYVVKYDTRKFPALNKKACAWKAAVQQGDTAVAESLRLEVWALAYEAVTCNLFTTGEAGIPELGPNAGIELGPWSDFEPFYDMACDRIESAMRNYDPQRGTFSGCLTNALKHGENDVLRVQGERRQRILHRDGNEVVIYFESLDETPGENDDDRIPLEETVPDPGVSVFNEVDSGNDDIIASIILLLNERRRTDSESRNRWFSLFFTEGITLYAREGIKSRKEKEIFSAINLDYLDFYMLPICRSLQKLGSAPLKTYAALGLSGGEVEVQLTNGFPADISISFLRSKGISGATRPNRSNFYRSYSDIRNQINN